MRRVVLVLACALAACTPYYQPTGPNVVPSMLVYVEVSDATDGHPLVAAVRYWFSGAESTATVQDTKPDGTTAFVVPAKTRDSHMWVQATGYVTQERHVNAGPGVLIKFALQKVPPPIPAPVSLEAPIKANFCGKRTPWGDVLFDIFLPVWTPAQRAWVYADKRQDGLTHIVLAAKGDYHGDHPFDYTRNPAGLAALMQEVRGQGFVPIVMLSSCDGGTGGDAEAYFGSLLDGLGEVRDQAHYVPGWECVKGGWTTKQFMHAVEIISAHVKPTTPIWFHGSDGRGTFASWPPELDDPTGGDEPGAWKTPVGRRLAGLLYQAESGRVLLRADEEPLDYLGQRGWRGRALEVLMRVQDGQRGWVPKRVVVFESVAEDYYAGRATDADVVRLANEGAALGFKEFGNGLPAVK